MVPEAHPIRSPQIILAAMALGVLALTGVALFLNRSGTLSADTEVARIMPLVIVAVALSEIPIYFMLRKQFLARVAAERGASIELVKQGRIPPPLQTLVIIGGALAESVGLFGGVALMLGASPVVLVAPALSVLLLVLQMPTQAKLEQIVRG